MSTEYKDGYGRTLILKRTSTAVEATILEDFSRPAKITLTRTVARQLHADLGDLLDDNPRTKALRAATDAYWGYMQEVEDNRAAFGRNPDGMHGNIIDKLTDAILEATAES